MTWVTASSCTLDCESRLFPGHPLVSPKIFSHREEKRALRRCGRHRRDGVLGSEKRRAYLRNAAASERAGEQ